jgi:hypothetical protein
MASIHVKRLSSLTIRRVRLESLTYIKTRGSGRQRGRYFLASPYWTNEYVPFILPQDVTYLSVHLRAM